MFTCNLAAVRSWLEGGGDPDDVDLEMPEAPPGGAVTDTWTLMAQRSRRVSFMRQM